MAPDAIAMAALHLLNTRPAAQAAALSSALRQAGFQVSELPLIAIVPCTLAASERRLLLDLDRYDGVLFISANAARLGLDAIADYWPQWPHALPVYAPAAGTAAPLRAAGLDVEVAVASADSEGLLQLPSLQQVAGKRFLLMRGVGGRELLRQSLQQRGAQVDVLELYQRQLPADTHTRWQQLSPPPDIVLLTSPVALQHWLQLAGPHALAPRWLVVSARQEAAARAAGARVLRAAGADSSSLLACLQNAGYPQ